MVTAERDGKFVADFASERSRLGKFEVVGVAGRALADKTGLRRNEGEVGFVPPANVLAYRRDNLHFGLGFLDARFSAYGRFETPSRSETSSAPW